MAKPKPVKQYKLKFRPTPISRLRKWNMPVPMVGDPNWCDRTRPITYQFEHLADAWKAREQAVYEAMCPDYKVWKERREMVEAGAEEYEKIIEAIEEVKI